MMGFNCLKVTEPLQGGSLLFTTKLFDQPQKDEGLSRSWSHPVVLSTAPVLGIQCLNHWVIGVWKFKSNFQRIIFLSVATFSLYLLFSV